MALLSYWEPWVFANLEQSHGFVRWIWDCSRFANFQLRMFGKIEQSHKLALNLWDCSPF